MVKINWNYEIKSGQEDAVWYHAAGVVGTATLETDTGTYSLNIRCDGETLVKIPYDAADLDSVEYVRYADQWERLGVTTDSEMSELTEKWSKLGVDIWEHNSWFDFYTEDGEHLDCVTHTIPDAVSQAEAVLREAAERGGW